MEETESNRKEFNNENTIETEQTEPRTSLIDIKSNYTYGRISIISSDFPNKIDLQQQVEQLETEKRKQQNEFDAQRAKLKELFLQKDAEHVKCQQELEVLRRELDEMRSQFLVADLKQENELQLKELKAQEEITSLQQLVQDTIEESAICKIELKHFKEECRRLRHENLELREQASSSSLAPQMLNSVKKSIVRKLGGESPGVVISENTDANKSVTTVKPTVSQEDSEVLHSIVEQLQEEMQALKQKLREADEKLQANQTDLIKFEGNNTANDSESEVLAENEPSCAALEAKIAELTNELSEREKKITKLEKRLEESKDTLEKEAALRSDLENQWQEKREEHKNEVQSLREDVKKQQNQLLALQDQFLKAKEEISRKLQLVTADRQKVNKHLETLQSDNAFLSGCYLETAEQIENQNINLPSTVDELQELLLKQREELIQARVNSEFEKRRSVSSLDEIQILRNQLEASNAERQKIKNKLQNEISNLQQRLTQHLLTLQTHETTKNNLERKEVELNRQISELRVEIIELKDANEKLNKSNADYKAKIKDLQDNLVTAEQVQSDFVKLSQSLQVSLEKLRNADSEVRWQDDDDITSCPTCKIIFTVTVRKIHCRHCGQIFCDKCLTKHVPSGPRKRNARVCDVCHTLLTPNTAPYFSQEAQMIK